MSSITNKHVKSGCDFRYIVFDSGKQPYDNRTEKKKRVSNIIMIEQKKNAKDVQ
jgi:hypothetical protein